MRVWPGQPYPLGATWTGLGVNFAIFSAHATRVELRLFDSPDATAPFACVRLSQLCDHRVHGRYDPNNLSWNRRGEGPADILRGVL
jgi:isoamylase